MTIAIASGKGGTGKTTVAVNLANSLDNGNITFLDCDVEEPNSHLFLTPEIENQYKCQSFIPKVNLSLCDFCGECSRICQFKAIAALKDDVLVFPELCHGCKGCQLLCPKDAITESFKEIGTIYEGSCQNMKYFYGLLRIGEAMPPPLIRNVKKKALNSHQPEAKDNNYVVIIDSPPGTSCPVIEAISDADFVLLVTEPTPFGLYDLKLAVETVRLISIPFGLVINRSTIGNRDVWDYCEKESIPILMEIPDERAIAEGYSRGKLIIDVFPEYKNKFKDLFEQVKNHQIRAEL